ncbi:hypothetical protein SEA_NANOSMITE_92 [Mycobacterium phage Nanosmite]|nr:hypothetical protein SEA_NANOSMITE_92 [Mycobacterium phage Nanosmite]
MSDKAVSRYDRMMDYARRGFYKEATLISVELADECIHNPPVASHHLRRAQVFASLYLK